jgi:tRNA threonylcarbamoyladenosine biosynthesis protein TsaB
VTVLLGIETATEIGSVALGDGSRLLGEVVMGTQARHAESLLPALDYLLAATGARRADIRGVVVGAGPGSFTGVRIAAATARGLACGLHVPLYVFSSLAAAALEAAGPGPVCVLFDARRGEVYAGCYAVEPRADRLNTLLEPTVLTVAELLPLLGETRPRFAGDGALRYAAELGAAEPYRAAPRASALLRLAASSADEGLIAEPAGWEPAYLRAPGAERGIAG